MNLPLQFLWMYGLGVVLPISWLMVNDICEPAPTISVDVWSRGSFTNILVDG
ncbi:hypothetical protein B6N60_03660 [Richelia sinica FACHB-800]|uniref:Uncharacterized protein n=1 Tax=Richelia sinica FACHB-800 TaxID=1357546 RepID=A0A975TAK6_9NOST|nr:hypothetical protein [Richelia sinica]MBD2664046.1 hypothetical protein [Richelia sinica FACHB-800]QXE24950.1 hypothetical protein B6N60_03660 [Richelia sinica FACHB-800]